ncbi:excinuclease ABC subunit UvrC [Pseudoroseomonas cervicalis]|uniref:excinuclease ABC subunit UvrC n=1 Tax=Teichococcus cervicalis TaxID=204525 RepID=UPI002781CFB7|nr:excinuclease ABC subunit UvrC [Pseudoroseomonas cervicalis]MDQ1079467.1 excinuclease ABC subunit C [Pseudoroseomonas cervicalis]
MQDRPPEEPAPEQRAPDDATPEAGAAEARPEAGPPQPGSDPDAPVMEGVAVIEAALATMPFAPGVYRMLDAKGDALYVGKARSLKKRVVSYTQLSRLPERLRRMVHATRRMEIITTGSEAEALLLEANLIKKLRPRFNIVLRDDKSYPWLVITEDHAYPQIAKHRGEKRKGASYWGPFASAWAVDQTLTALQKVFLLRSCRDTVFDSRDRPCLLHQIKRCAAPCVGRISEADYAGLVRDAKKFLSGETPSIQKALAKEMEQAAESLEFERAAALRDRIRGLTHVQGQNAINLDGVGDADVVALHQIAGQSCVQVFFFRGGRNNGNRSFFPSHLKDDAEPEEVLSAFLTQLYDDLPPPPLVLLSHALPDAGLIAEALTLKAGRKVELHAPQRGEKRQAVEHAATNAREALERRLAEGTAQVALLEGVARLFDLPEPPRRIEIYDNSHIQGSHAYGVMVVAGPEGFMKNAYRKYAIQGGGTGRAAATQGPGPSAALPQAAAEAPPRDPGDVAPALPGATPPRIPAALVAEVAGALKETRPAGGGDRIASGGGDDFAMMREVFERRFGRALKEDPERQGEGWPDLVLIDGGAGQLSAAREVMAELGLGDLNLVAVAKGPDRDAGREWFHRDGHPPLQLPPRDPVLYYLQRLRDEAHRFAITTHRAGRSKAITRSELDEIPGVGSAIKRRLLNHFGSARGVRQAGLEDLQNCPGIGPSMAVRIHEHFHPGAAGANLGKAASGKRPGRTAGRE